MQICFNKLTMDMSELIEIDQQRTTLLNNGKAAWIRPLLQEIPPIYELVIPFFVNSNDTVAIPFCDGGDKTPPYVSAAAKKVYLINDDISTVKDKYRQPNITCIEATLPNTKDKVPTEMDVVVTRDKPECPDTLFAFLDSHLKEGGIYLDFVMYPLRTKVFDHKNYPLFDVASYHPEIKELFNMQTSIARVYQKTTFPTQ